MDKKVEEKYVCGACKGELVPSGCGCRNEKCANYMGKWPKPGTMYAPPKDDKPKKAKVKRE